MRARGEEYLTWPQRALFDKIGIRRQVLETDPYGNFLLTGYDYGTARNWARLGLLYLNDGVWHGERLLPEGFVKFVSTPAPAWKDPIYGGMVWVNGAAPGTCPATRSPSAARGSRTSTSCRRSISSSCGWDTSPDGKPAWPISSGPSRS